MAALPPHHCAKGGFRNPWLSFKWPMNVYQAMRLMWEWDRKRSRPTPEVLAQLQVAEPDWRGIENPPKNAVQVTWVGHSTFLVQFDGVNVLTDPVWANRCSPTQLAGPRRLVPPPFPIAKLPPLDMVILSHNHYDHMDESSVKALGNKPLYLAPLGVGRWLKELGIDNLVELDWWQGHDVSVREATSPLRATCTPAQHGSGRTAWDRNDALWCSWVLEGPSKRVFFSGDTGFCSVPRGSTWPGGDPAADPNGPRTSAGEPLPVCPAFAEIGNRHGPFDTALIPIGAYSPRWFMSPVHCSPEDAVALHLAVRSKQSVGMHWGTFVLTDEPILEPPQRLQKELVRLGIDPLKFIAMRHGETKAFATAGDSKEK